MLDALAAEALRAFGVRDYRLTLVASSFNTVFRVSRRGESLLLRVGPPHRIHDAAAAQAEYAWTSFLADHGFAVPRIVLTEAGAASVRVTTSEVAGERECMLLGWRPGRTIPRPVSARDITDLALLVAALHDAPDALPQVPRGVLDGRRVLHFDIPNLLADTADRHRSVFRDATLRAQHAIDELWSDPRRTPRLIHSDLTPNNVVRSRGRLAAIDFQDLTRGHVEQDLTNSLYGVSRGVDLDRVLATFRAGYERVRPWPRLDRTLLAHLVAARRLEMANLALYTGRPGVEQYLDGHAEVLRTYLATATPMSD